MPGQEPAMNVEVEPWGLMAGDIVTATVVVINPQGIHARPADMFVKTACQYESKIEVIKDGERVDGKSILAMLTLAAVVGTKLQLEVTGPDAQAALAALTQLVQRGFDENETIE
jgi:phosphocarrier protein HPr